MAAEPPGVQGGVMGRTLTADGKRMPVSVKVSEAKFRAIEAARGAVPRALWLESLIDAELGWDGSREAATGERASAARTEPPRTVSVPARGEPAMTTGQVRCLHPSGRVENGVCGDCHEEVWA